MIHYHGTPITPREHFASLVGRHFCVRFGEHRDLDTCLSIGQSVMLDNGAFSFWQQGIETTPAWWDRYADWAAPYLDSWNVWAVLPDTITGTEADNDYLLARFCRRFGRQGAPVWHMHESLERLVRLVVGYERVCIGSSGLFANPGSPEWNQRMDEAFNRICIGGKPRTPIHMLRAMSEAVSGPWPFASADSTNVARNHNRDAETPSSIAARWDARQPPARWRATSQLVFEE